MTVPIIFLCQSFNMNMSTPRHDSSNWSTYTLEHAHKNFSEHKHEEHEGISVYTCSSHTCFPRLICQEKKKKVCALKASFSKKSYLTESHRMHLPGLENPQWYRRRDNSRNTYFLHSPMRAERQQLQDQPLDGNTQITVPVISSGPHLSHKWSGCQRDVYLHIGLSWEKKKKPDFSWMSVLADWFANDDF